MNILWTKRSPNSDHVLRLLLETAMSEAELRDVLQNRKLVSSPIVEVVNGKSQGYLQIRRIDMGRVVGSDYLKGSAPANFITPMSDRYGNFITAFSGI